MTHYPDHHIVVLTTVVTVPAKELWVQMVNLDAGAGNTYSLTAPTSLIAGSESEVRQVEVVQLTSSQKVFIISSNLMFVFSTSVISSTTALTE